MNFIMVAVGGFFGSITRFGLANLVKGHFIGTWLTNISGSSLLAFLFYLYTTNTIHTPIWFLTGVGFCGAYTTFSTFSNETIQMLIEKRHIQAIIYVCSSIVLNIGIFVLIFYLLS